MVFKALGLVGVLAASSAVLVAQQARDAQQPSEQAAPKGTAVIMGRVTVAGTGQPAADVRVSITGPELRSSRSALTDDDGQFVFTALPAGTYTVRGSRTGFTSGTFGQKQPGKPGTPIALVEGQQLKNVSFDIAKGGVISGSVVDEKNRPSIGTSVRVMRWLMQSGERVLTTAGTGTTDDRGIYRVHSLMPGDYIVSAVPRNTSLEVITSADAEAMERLAQLQAQGLAAGTSFTVNLDSGLQVEVANKAVQGYAPVFFPGTPQVGSARTVKVGVGDEQLGIDFPLQRVALTSVTGQVIMPAGQNVTAVQVRLMQPDGVAIGIGQQTTRPSQTGAFTFNSVVPGQYVVFATATFTESRTAPPPVTSAPQVNQGGQRRLWAQAEVFVDGSYPPAVTLSMQDGLTVTGGVTFEGTTPLPTANQRARVALSPLGQPLQSMGLGGLNATVDQSGRFTVLGVVPGRYRVSAAGLQGWFVKSVMVNGVDVLDFPFDIAPGGTVPNVTIHFGDRNTELKGVLTDAAGTATADYSVVIFPEDQRYWIPFARRMRSARPSTDGKFTFAGLPPGEYRLAAVTDVESGEWLDPEFLRQLLPASVVVRLSDGLPVTQDLRVR